MFSRVFLTGKFTDENSNASRAWSTNLMVKGQLEPGTTDCHDCHDCRQTLLTEDLGGSQVKISEVSEK